MVEQQVRELLLKRAAKAGSVAAWCRENGLLKSRATEFLQGKRPPNGAMLSALGLERRIVRKARGEA